MKAAWVRIKDHFVNWRAWELNPVVVKELRQAVRSWAVTGMLLLFLVILFCTALAFLITQTFQVSMDQWLGLKIFSWFLGILTGASLLFIPLYVGVRLAAERQESNLDLLYITTLTPGRIIRGKLFCGMYVTLLFFSACMPFMVFTNLLRGIDLPTIFFILMCLFLIVCVAIQVAIFFACLPISKLLKILIALFGLVGMFMMIGGLVAFFAFTMASGVGSTMGSRDFWIQFVTSTGLVFAAVLLLYFLSVALISPLSANRALPVRSYVTLMWLVGAALALYWTLKRHDARLMLPWTVVTFILMMVAMIVVISNHDELSVRVRRTIPAHPLRRALAFLFYNGAAGGLVWIVFLMSVTAGLTSWFLHNGPGTVRKFTSLPAEELYNFEITNGAVFIYALAYGLTALFIQRQFMGGRSPKVAGIFALLLPGLWALVPYITFFFLNRLTWTTLERNQLGNIFNVYVVKDDNQKLAHLICAGAWLLLMFILNARWFARQVKQFKPLERPNPTPVATQLPPPVPNIAS